MRFLFAASSCLVHVFVSQAEVQLSDSQLVLDLEFSCTNWSMFGWESQASADELIALCCLCEELQ